MKTIEEWSNRIEAAEPRDYDTVNEAMRRIAKLHLEMLGELAARLEEIGPEQLAASPPTDRIEQRYRTDVAVIRGGFRVAPDLLGEPTLWCLECGRDSGFHHDVCAKGAKRS